MTTPPSVEIFFLLLHTRQHVREHFSVGVQLSEPQTEQHVCLIACYTRTTRTSDCTMDTRLPLLPLAKAASATCIAHHQSADHWWSGAAAEWLPAGAHIGPC
jgi:hypothetical protein